MKCSDTALRRTVACLFIILDGITCQSADIKKIDEIVTAWAPLVWLAPNEKFYPLGVEEFLQHVYFADKNGFPFWNASKTVPEGLDSENFHLYTKRSIDDILDRNKTFIHGRNPNETPVPVYAVVNQCNQKIKIKSHLHFTVSYWFFFPYNLGKELCIFGRFPIPMVMDTCIGKRQFVGNHVGDFEHISLVFRGHEYPDEIFVQTHDAGAYYAFDYKNKLFNYRRQAAKRVFAPPHKFPQQINLLQGRIQVFSSLGSHGIWAEPGEHLIWRIPKVTDNSGYGAPWRTWKALQIHHRGISKLPAWMDYQGRWGHPKSNCFITKCCLFSIYCEYVDGPKGILDRMEDFYCAM